MSADQKKTWRDEVDASKKLTELDKRKASIARACASVVPNDQGNYRRGPKNKTRRVTVPDAFYAAAMAALMRMKREREKRTA